jgi:hypothetical protein
MDLYDLHDRMEKRVIDTPECRKELKIVEADNGGYIVFACKYMKMENGDYYDKPMKEEGKEMVVLYTKEHPFKNDKKKEDDKPMKSVVDVVKAFKG